MMKIEVRLFATLTDRQPDPPEMTLPEGATAGQLLAALSLTPEEATVILVDGRAADPDTVLHDKALVSLLPLVTGG